MCFILTYFWINNRQYWIHIKYIFEFLSYSKKFTLNGPSDTWYIKMISTYCGKNFLSHLLHFTWVLIDFVSISLNIWHFLQMTLGKIINKIILCTLTKVSVFSKRYKVVIVQISDSFLCYYNGKVLMTFATNNNETKAHMF